MSRIVSRVGKLAKDVQKQTGRVSGVGLCGSGLHGRKSCRGSRKARDQIISGEITRGQARLCVIAQAMGGGTQLRMAGAFSPTGEGLREAGIYIGRNAFGRFHFYHAGSTVQIGRKCITRSSASSWRFAVNHHCDTGLWPVPMARAWGAIRKGSSPSETESPARAGGPCHSESHRTIANNLRYTGSWMCV